ncbi:hypothetical protein TG4357_00596 [Thalassovita gelatinovora]|uniref:Beta-barrel assembly machine subunit BamF n=1 Tax=Thalassovita gelatinovora TaxID=53501 RepID=A0A0P1FM50_THAGE|nr:DUF3035 domain-containing protein [Thalassovita gelatinovora]QIZ80863.1 DUF3035 domain-containing protein [Thalassovita gelatinovora]CUH63311.1 hypothetical protein TG4357_00596 [Thalassovita gelatinovora]SEQ65004.1 Beta-barrel assembly machine subunit BamF [Thalassovita gelatinovora]
MPRAWLLIAGLVLAACSGEERDISLRDLRSFTDGPDEFSIIPGKELQAPKDYSALPTPTPGGSNLTDQDPIGDGIAALGGRASARQLGTGIPAADGALVTHASRKGVPSDIRESLAAEDEDFRRRKSRFTKIRIVKVDRYSEAYQREKLNAHAVQEWWRRRGVATPTAPPDDR